MPRLLLLGLLVGLAAGPAAVAQPDPAAAPAAGTVRLETGFTPDPHAVDLQAGGTVDAAAVSDECVGFVSAAPSVVVDYEGGGGLPLYLFARSSTDTVMLVRTPGGTWLCNDDDESANPGLFLDEPASGRYAVWVGTYADAGTDDVLATLYVSELDAPSLDPEGEPVSGRLSLGAGFTPDPYEVDVEAGGPSSVSSYEGCAGFVDAAAPTFVLDFEADAPTPLYVYARAAGDDDLTLAVMRPDGSVKCNDDADGLNPGLAVEAAEAGRYAVWVGTFSSRARTEDPVRATLAFSEVEGPVGGEFVEDDYVGGMEDGAYEGGEDISLFAEPAHGLLTVGPTVREETVSVQAGGADPVSVTGFGCAGYIASGEPDVNVLYTAGDGAEGALAFYAESDDDTTLLVNLPDGSWRCSDDEMGRNPGIEIETPAGGLYNVWVGTYAQGTGSPATLHVTERLPR